MQKGIAESGLQNTQRQQSGIIHQQPHSTAMEEVLEAEMIVIDSPEKRVESLEEQFSEVEDEFHDSRSSMDIDSDDGATEPEDTDTETTISSKHHCIPSTTRHDREELRIVRNNFAEEYDPWDTSMVPEYAEEIFRYMRELEVFSSSCHL